MMVRLMIIATQALVATAAAIPLRDEKGICNGDQAPKRISWLRPDDPPRQDGAPSSFFYVNQDVAGPGTSSILNQRRGLSQNTDSSVGRKTNRVVQLVSFRVPIHERYKCQLLLSLPEEPSQWELVQREGPRAPALNVYMVGSPSNAHHDYDALMGDASLVGSFDVRPGTQTIELGSCGSGNEFLFEVGNPEESRVAFSQALDQARNDDAYGVLLRYDCTHPMPTTPGEL
jgi:hypothetical protein